MIRFFIFFMLIPFIVSSQHTIQAELTNQYPADNFSFVEVDNFGTTYYIKENTFHKVTPQERLDYSNYQLGNPSSANIFNPLKICLFYQDFNTLIILDNRLAEIFKIDFNQLQPYKNVIMVSPGNDNNIWVFNLISQSIELYDFKNNAVKAKTLPINEKPLDLISNYNYCWLLTDNHIYKYNYFGSLIYKIKNKGFEAIKQFNDSLFLLKQNTIYKYNESMQEFTQITIPKLLIKQFFVNNESLYIYTNKTLKQFHLKYN